MKSTEASAGQNGEHHVVISAVGACTSMGDSVHAAAAFRTGIALPKELEALSIDDDETEKAPLHNGHPIAGVTDSFEGLGRYIRMGGAALSDLLSTQALTLWRPEKYGLPLLSTEVH